MRLLFLVTIFLFYSCHSIEKIPTQNIFHLSIDDTKIILSHLAADSLRGRLPGDVGFEKAASFVSEYLKNNSIKPFFKEGFNDTLLVENKISYNVVGWLKAKKPTNDYILLGAHLDHLGLENSAIDSVYNGANDDASGVTAVLQIAKALSQTALNKNVIFAFFTGEESGLIGSGHLAPKLKSMGINLQYMINFEMIGTVLTSGLNQVYITGYHRSYMADKMNEMAGQNFVQFLPSAKDFHLFFRSDNYSFYKEFKVPCQTLSTFDFKNYEFYHQLGDGIAQLDLSNMNQLINTSYRVIYQLLQKDIQIKLTEAH